MKDRVIKILLIANLIVTIVSVAVYTKYIHDLTYYIGITEQQNSILRQIINKEMDRIQQLSTPKNYQ